MGEKGNAADAAGAVSRNVITDTVSSGVDVVSGIATGAVTGVATGVAKDSLDEKLRKPDEPTG